QRWNVKAHPAIAARSVHPTWRGFLALRAGPRKDGGSFCHRCDSHGCDSNQRRSKLNAGAQYAVRPRLSDFGEGIPKARERAEQVGAVAIVSAVRIRELR